MEVDEHLALLNDDRFTQYRSALRNMGALRDPRVFDRPSIPSVSVDPSSGTAATKGKRQQKHMSHPSYVPLQEQVDLLVAEVRRLVALSVAAERRQLIVEDDDFDKAARESDGITKELSIKVMYLSNLLAYRVIVDRKVPEMTEYRVRDEARRLLMRRADLLRGNPDKKKMTEAYELFLQAGRTLQGLGEHWPGKHDMLVLTPPHSVTTGAAVSATAATTSPPHQYNTEKDREGDSKENEKAKNSAKKTKGRSEEATTKRQMNMKPNIGEVLN